MSCYVVWRVLQRPNNSIFLLASIFLKAEMWQNIPHALHNFNARSEMVQKLRKDVSNRTTDWPAPDMVGEA